MNAEQLIQTLEKDLRLIRSMMKAQWPEFAQRVADMTTRFEGVTTEQEISDLGRQVFAICQEYDFVRQRLALAEEYGPLVYRLPDPKPLTHRDLASVANRFVAFGQAVAPDPKPKPKPKTKTQ